jgi:hypothetical protein
MSNATAVNDGEAAVTGSNGFVMLVIAAGMGVFAVLLLGLKKLKEKQNMKKKRGELDDKALMVVKKQVRWLMIKYERARLTAKSEQESQDEEGKRQRRRERGERRAAARARGDASDDEDESSEEEGGETGKEKEGEIAAPGSGPLSQMETARLDKLLGTLPQGLQPLLVFRNDLKRKHGVYRDTLLRMYKEKAPEKLDYVDNILENVEGEEEKFISQMKKKYYKDDEAGEAGAKGLMRSDSAAILDLGELVLDPGDEKLAMDPDEKLQRAQSQRQAMRAAAREEVIFDVGESEGEDDANERAPQRRASRRGSFQVDEGAKSELLQKQMDPYGRGAKRRSMTRQGSAGRGLRRQGSTSNVKKKPLRQSSNPNLDARDEDAKIGTADARANRKTRKQSYQDDGGGPEAASQGHDTANAPAVKRKPKKQNSFNLDNSEGANAKRTEAARGAAVLLGSALAAGNKLTSKQVTEDESSSSGEYSSEKDEGTSEDDSAGHLISTQGARIVV